MLSYRHAFHAGNHADVLKHLCLVSTLTHLLQKDTPLHCLDTHAGAGAYRLDEMEAQKSGEADGGIALLMAKTGFSPAEQASAAVQSGAKEELPDALKHYLEAITAFNTATGAQGLRNYPGSPLLTHRLLRPHDRMKLFELHPTDGALLEEHLAQLPRNGARHELLKEDGFEGWKRFLPPPQDAATKSRRAFVLMDPAYEVKTDYPRASGAVAAMLQKFPTGVVMVWFPVVARPEAHELPRRLRAAAQKVGKPWLQATLCVGRVERPSARVLDNGRVVPPKASALIESGVFIVNPPFTLKAQLQAALPVVQAALSQGAGAGFEVTSGG